MFNLQESIDSLKKQYPEWNKKEYPEFCSACGDVLTDKDSIMTKINEVKSGYKKKRVKGLFSLRNSERYQRGLEKERKAAVIFIPEIEKFNKLLRLERSEVKHDACKGDAEYCAYDGSKLKIYGFQGTEKGYETNLVCGLCRHYDMRPMTTKDRRVFLTNSSVIAKMLL